MVIFSETKNTCFRHPTYLAGGVSGNDQLKEQNFDTKIYTVIQHTQKLYTALPVESRWRINVCRPDKVKNIVPLPKFHRYGKLNIALGTDILSMVNLCDKRAGYKSAPRRTSPYISAMTDLRNVL